MLYLNIILSISIFIITCIISYMRWETLSRIYNKKSSFFNIFFIIIYPIQELIFLTLYNFSGQKNFLINLLLIILLLTLALDKTHLKIQNEKVITRSKNEAKKALEKQQNEIYRLEKNNSKLLDYINQLKIK